MTQVPDDRRDDRAPVAVAAKCGPEAGRKAFVALIDLTVAGCCLFAREVPFVMGQTVILHPECLAPLKATVQWQRGHMTGIRFENELYPAVFEHLARTHPWKLPTSAKIALDRGVEVPAAVQRELSTVIDRAEEKFSKRNVPTDVYAKRPLVIGSRSGFSGQARNRQLANVFLA